MHRSEIFPLMSVQGQKPALPRRSIGVCFALNKQTLTGTGSMQRYVPLADVSRCSNVKADY